jgi:hypothetical protein
MVASFFTGFDSTPQAITQKALSNSFNLEEKERREEALLNKDFYYGKQEQSLHLINEDVDPIIINLTKPIIGKRTSLLYRRPLKREFSGPASSIRLLEQVYHDNAIDALLHQADLLAELTGSALVHPLSDDTLSSGMRLRLYDASQFAVTGNDGDPNTADSISLVRVVDRLINPDLQGMGERQPQVERVLLQQVWTNESVVSYEGQNLANTETNPLGFLPFVNFKGEEVHDQYIGFPTTTIVRKLNAHINQLLTLLGYTIKMQSGTPIALTGFQSGEQVTIHPGRAISLPTGADAKVLQLTPKIQETLETINHLEQQLYATSGVPKVTVEGNNDGGNTHISASQLIVRWFPLLEVFKEKAVRFERYEWQLANMILAMNGMPAIEDVHIEWAEEEVLPVSHEDEMLVRDISLNLRTPIDELMRRNDFLSEAEAEALWRRNIEINSENTPDEEPEEAPEEEEEKESTNATDKPSTQDAPDGE